MRRRSRRQQITCHHPPKAAQGRRSARQQKRGGEIAAPALRLSNRAAGLVVAVARRSRAARLEALPAVDRLVGTWLEGNLGFPPALRADRRVHLPRPGIVAAATPRVTAAAATAVAAGGVTAAAGIVAVAAIHP